ncbi:MAG TPA: hypothetical protein VGC03_15750 [Acidimicrobiia bacterium]
MTENDTAPWTNTTRIVGWIALWAELKPSPGRDILVFGSLSIGLWWIAATATFDAIQEA